MTLVRAYNSGAGHDLGRNCNFQIYPPQTWHLWSWACPWPEVGTSLSWACPWPKFPCSQPCRAGHDLGQGWDSEAGHFLGQNSYEGQVVRRRTARMPSGLVRDKNFSLLLFFLVCPAPRRSVLVRSALACSPGTGCREESLGRFRLPLPGLPCRVK